MFVGDINNGNLYRFTLNEARDDIVINNTNVGGAAALSDKKVIIQLRVSQLRLDKVSGELPIFSRT